MVILMFGDIVGKIGRGALHNIMPKLKKKYTPDLVIANGENAAHGIGLTQKTAQALFDMGINVLTGGNHIFKKKESDELLNAKNIPILRPANYPPNVPGKGYIVYRVGSKKVLIVNLIGRVFFNEDFDCPFRALEAILKENKNVKIKIVDMHAEATSEAKAIGLYFDGRVSAMLGTHTHIPTADNQILPGGTAYMTDLGMVGPKDSVIGVKKEKVFERFLTQLPTKFEVPETGLCEVNGAIIEIDDKTGKAKKIERVYEEVTV